MVAGWAALRAGYDVTYYSNTAEKSKLMGCQYLHAPIPLPPSYKIPQRRVEYKLNGTAEEYRAKVYGEGYHGVVSPEDFIGEHDAWDIRATYDALWDMITQRKNVTLHRVKVTNNWLALNTGPLSEYAHVISTIPATALCQSPVMHPSQEGHLFTSQTIKAVGSKLPIDFEDIISCDGTPNVPWYRMAFVFGYRTVEWPRGAQPVPTDAVAVRKPLSTDCDCHPEIIRLGRYGAWQKGVLVHEVYNQASALMRGEWPT